MSRLQVTPNRCSGCRSCEMACAFAHAVSEPAGATASLGLQPGRPRLRIWASPGAAFIPMLCLQCDDARCVRACAYGALARSETTGAIELDSRRCTRCLLCTAACPFGNVELEAAMGGLVVKCDLCHGAPACAKFCPTGALAWS
ncbi:MAG: 4Fe-4S dicluster domain-containing protein [Candidatus Wallbacteria bacterium]|nr:4Fe-4S dicluster domain-containing protein [Candidatus Wallbacteria bacterium]